jgi:hypothetical protein
MPERQAGAVSGITQGATTGAAIGSVVPGIGTAIGGIVGGIIGGIGGLFSGSKKRKARRAREAAQRQLFQMQRTLREEALSDQELLAQTAFGLQMAGLERETAGQLARLDLAQTGTARSTFAQSAQAATRTAFEEQRGWMIEQHQAQLRAVGRDRTAIEIDRVAMEAGIQVGQLETSAQATAQMIGSAFQVGGQVVGSEWFQGKFG